MKSCLFVALLVVTAGVQAGEADPVASEALQIVTAAHFNKKMRDTTAKDIAANPQTSGQGSSGAAVALGVGTATGAFSALPGLSQSMSTGLSGVNILSTFPKFDIARTARLIAFMPKEMAATPDQAREKLTDILLQAAIKAMPDASVELVLNTELQNHIAITRPGCVDCRIFLKPLEKYVKPKLQQTPEFLGGVGEVWAWGHPDEQGDGLLGGYPWHGESLTPNERQGFLVAFNAQLPAWVSFFLPSDAEKLAPFAQVLRQGQVKLFLDPRIDPQLATPALSNAEQP